MAAIARRRAEALWGMFVGDSLAMPVHWYYRPYDIKKSYNGWLTGYNAPAAKHPSSILSLSATDGSGRKGYGAKVKKSVIGEVILHGKLQYWTSNDNTVHYHQGMKAGDNTLNAIMALETAKLLQKVDPNADVAPIRVFEAYMENYVTFMTTPGSHNDTYAESFHRSFFKEWINEDTPPTKGSELYEFAMRRYKSVISEDHQLPVIGALAIAVPWIVHYAALPEHECKERATTAIKLTHPAPSLIPYVELYAQLLHRVINGGNLREEILTVARHPQMGKPTKADVIQKFSSAAQEKTGDDKLMLCQEAAAILGMACYIQGAMATMMFLGHEFHDNFSQGVLTNANCGGENAHRGAALGALLGAAQGVGEEWKAGLQQAENIRQVEQNIK